MEISNFKLCVVLATMFFFTSCENDQKVSDKEIEKTAEDVKVGLDKLASGAKKFLEEGRMDKLKEVVDDVAEKGKSMARDGEIWQAKLEKLKNDPEVQKLLKELEGEGKEVLDDLKEFEKELEANETLKAKLEGIDTDEELEAFIKTYNGEGKEILLKFEQTIKNLKTNKILKEKWEAIENDEEIKALLKKYETDGKEILEKLEEVFEGLESK